MVEQIAQETVLRDMSEGVMIIDPHGTIRKVNPAAGHILEMNTETLDNGSFAALFIQNQKNDAFVQFILDAVYDKQKTNVGVIRYFTGESEKWLRISTSYQQAEADDDGRCVVVVFSDVSDLIALQEENRRMAEDALHALRSFVQVMVTAVDAKSPYNANHTRSMVRYAERFLDWAAKEENHSRFAGVERDPILVSIWLHDIGKLGIPLEIMDKPTRLGNLEYDLWRRIEIALLRSHIREMEYPSRHEEQSAKREEIRKAEAIIREANTAGYLTDSLENKIKGIFDLRCENAEGEEVPLLTEHEKEALSVQRGTLTTQERKTIESHVTLTAKMLEQMYLTGRYSAVSEWASDHHEFLDGTGYPLGKKGDQITLETRLITILDIFDALTAEDRPYKPSISAERALHILHSMCDEGKIDGDVLKEFENSHAWDQSI